MLYLYLKKFLYYQWCWSWGLAASSSKFF